MFDNGTTAIGSGCLDDMWPARDCLRGVAVAPVVVSGSSRRATRRLALAETELAADPRLAGKQRCQGDPTRCLTIDAVEVRTLGE